jgi:hypothetical protein
MQDKNLGKQLDKLSPGDLVCVEWCDASVGKSLGSGVAVDVPVKSFGVFIGVLGSKNKHVVIAQNAFKYSDGFFDIDYTSIPLSWTVQILLVTKNLVNSTEAQYLVNSFLMGGRRTLQNRTRQQKVRNHDRLH